MSIHWLSDAGSLQKVDIAQWSQKGGQPEPQKIGMLVSADPRLEGGTKYIEFEIGAFTVTVLSGNVTAL
jgi:hypothetical protein